MTATKTRTRKPLDVDTVRDAASSRWPEILVDVGGMPPELLDSTREHPCPKCSGNTRCRFIDKQAGAVRCSHCHFEKCGDGFATIMWLLGCSFPEAAAKVAEYLGLKPNKRAKADPAKDLAWMTWSSELAKMYLAAKPGITERAIIEAGGRMARYKRSHTVIAFPIIGETLDVNAPVGWLLVNATGGTLPKLSKDGDVVGAVDKKITWGSKSGLVGASAVEQMKAGGVEVAWKCEGLTDLLALTAAIPAEFVGRHIVVTNAGGAGENLGWMAKALATSGAAVYVLHDADDPGQAGAAKAAKDIAAQGGQDPRATVRLVKLPYPVEPTHGKDVRDWLNEGNSYSDLVALAERSDEVQAEDSGESTLTPAGEMDPANEAEKILATEAIDGVPRVRYWRCSIWCWESGRYAEKPDGEVRAEIVNYLNQTFSGVKRANASDVLEHLRAKSLLRSEIVPPSWLVDAPDGFDADKCLATQGSVIHLPSLVSQREPSIVPASPAYFVTSACDFDIDLDAPRPSAWLQFLHEIWSDDQPCIDALQEWFGYSLTADTRQQKVCIVVGPKRSGKRTIARVLASIVGKSNVAAPTLASLATNFGLWPLIGKSLAIISDARLSGRTDQVAVVERLLSISGEDSITIDRKNMQPLTCRLGVRFMILTNELPRLSDASGAIVSRMILLRMTRSFFGKEDHGLSDRLLAERKGILLWAIEGWRRLRGRGCLVQPDSGFESLGEMNDLASPVAAFVRDCCEVNPTEAVVVADLFAAWQRWCKEQGREKFAGSVQSFARDLLAAEPGVRRKRTRDGEGRTRIYEGIGLRDGF